MTTIRRLRSTQPDFDAQLRALLALESAQDASIESTVAEILDDVKTRGDAALLDYTRRFDRLESASVAAWKPPSGAFISRRR